MSTCVQCNIPVDPSANDVVKCSMCNDYYHRKCAGVDALKKPNTRKNSFRCVKCSGSSVSASNSDSEEFGGNLQVLQAISGLKSDMRVMIDSKLESVEKTITDKMEVSFSAIHSEINAIKSNFQDSIDSLKNENEALKGRCDSLEGNLKAAGLAVHELKGQICDLQQYSRLSNIEIVGVPLTNNEDVYSILEKVVDSINVPWQRNDISVAHRLPSNQRGRHPSIVVRFISRSTRAAWLAAARKKRDLNTVHLSSTFTPGPVFINEHLTAHTKAVLSMAKKMVKDEKLAFAWVKEGRVLVRKTADSRPRRVSDVGDLEKLE